MHMVICKCPMAVIQAMVVLLGICLGTDARVYRNICSTDKVFDMLVTTNILVLSESDSASIGGIVVGSASNRSEAIDTIMVNARNGAAYAIHEFCKHLSHRINICDNDQFQHNSSCAHGDYFNGYKNQIIQQVSANLRIRMSGKILPIYVPRLGHTPKCPGDPSSTSVCIDRTAIQTDCYGENAFAYSPGGDDYCMQYVNTYGQQSARFVIPFYSTNLNKVRYTNVCGGVYFTIYGGDTLVANVYYYDSSDMANVPRTVTDMYFYNYGKYAEQRSSFKTQYYFPSASSGFKGICTRSNSWDSYQVYLGVVDNKF